VRFASRHAPLQRLCGSRGRGAHGPAGARGPKPGRRRAARPPGSPVCTPPPQPGAGAGAQDPGPVRPPGPLHQRRRRRREQRRHQGKAGAGAEAVLRALTPRGRPPLQAGRQPRPLTWWRSCWATLAAAQGPRPLPVGCRS
jgi:hypothetical protein